ncbi:MAG: hypothetical protein HY044_02040 [Candidatus Woesebacteria bacterium]|nr:MAG: hypothetical protein HY044_02040 [Candidatus Woesebacteria bacterium]
MNKKIIVSGFFILSSFVIASNAFAQTGSPASNLKDRSGQKRQELLTDRADQEIERRITSLNNLITRIQAMKKISDSQKSAFLSQIQSEITSLTNLKAKIDADTDPEILLTDKKSILTEYRVYWLFIPKFRIVASADRILEISDDLSALVTKIQKLIDSAKQKNGKDISSTNSIISEIQTKLIDAKTQAQNAIDTVSNLTPDGGDASKMSANTQALQSARSMLKNALLDLNNVRFDIQKIRVILIGFRQINKTVSSSASPIY